MKIKDLPVEERPREKLVKFGVNNLTDEEVLAILLKTGTRGMSVKELTYELLESVGGIKNLEEITLEKLKQIKGIGSVKAIEILAAIDIGKRIFIRDNDVKKRFLNAEDIFKSMRYLFYNKKQECFYCLYFNTKRELLERKLLFMGTVNKSIVHPREIFKEAYLVNASSIIVMHNHPSGDVTPSVEDINFTRNLVSIGKLNGIYINDHIIVGNESFYSFYEESIIDF